MSVDVIGNGNDDGTNFGRSDDKLGFFGLTTPIVQITVSSAIITSAALSTSDPFGFASASQADTLLALVNQLRAALVAYGLIA